MRQVRKDGKNRNRCYGCCHKDGWAGRSGDEKRCKFFRWLTPSEVGSSPRAKKACWAPVAAPTDALDERVNGGTWLDSRRCTRLRLWGADGPRPGDVGQGSLGDCWFLSAISVIAGSGEERIRRLFSKGSGDGGGAYEVFFWVDGEEEGVVVDSHLPVRRVEDAHKKKRKASTPHAVVHPSNEVKPGGEGKAGAEEVIPLYSKTINGTLWVPVLEKAYAKRHGCYDALSGGWVWEALFDMLCAPCEVLHLQLHADGDKKELLWSTILSFVEAKFVTGASCMRSNKEEGLVGLHAYSLLDAKEIYDVKTGEQTKIDAHFTSDAEVQVVGEWKPGDIGGGRRNLRLVRLRNPWGKKGFTGEFGEKDERWTKRLRELVGYSSADEGRGDFWMTYERFLTAFTSVDVCKYRDGWSNISLPDVFKANENPYGEGSVTKCSAGCFVVDCDGSSSMILYVTTVQKKRRGGPVGGPGTLPALVDASFVVSKRRKGGAEEAWEPESLHCCGETRLNSAELMINPGWQYMVTPFRTKNIEDDVPFRILLYSPRPPKVERVDHPGTITQGIKGDDIMTCLQKIPSER